ncbi:MAG: type II secretion system F family protein [Actinomycetota bacterium]|nr:type II secretion system F family protein [Actinomycetota bacterium]
MHLIAAVAAAGAIVAGIGARRRVGVARALVAPRRRHRQAPTTTQQWAELLSTVAAEVRTGSSPIAAHAHAMQQAPWCRHTNHPGDDERVVLQALHATRTLGGPVAATLDAAAALLRERLAIRAEATAHSAQARLSARVLTIVPLVFCAWNLATSASFRAAWLAPVGRVCAALGVACNALGWWWMRRIITKATQ